MTKLEKIEDEIRSLDAAELEAFRRWFAAFDAAAWDDRFARDVTLGRLDGIADRALAEHRAGRTRPL